MAEETFAVLREAMRTANKVAIARLVLSSRERIVTIGARDKGMFVETLRDPNEVRASGEYFESIPAASPTPKCSQLAEKLIEQKVTKFDPKLYEDRYETALMEMIREKLKGHKPIIAAAPERGNVINLMDALKASLGQAKPAAPSKSKAEAGRRSKDRRAKPSLKQAVAASKAAAAKAPAPRRRPERGYGAADPTLGSVGALSAFPQRLAARRWRCAAAGSAAASRARPRASWSAASCSTSSSETDRREAGALRASGIQAAERERPAALAASGRGARGR